MTAHVTRRVAPVAAVAVAVAAVAVAVAVAGVTGCGKRKSRTDDAAAAARPVGASGRARGASAPGTVEAGVPRRPTRDPEIVRPEGVQTRQEAVSTQVRNARSAADAGDHELARQLCEEILTVDGSNQDALSICTAAACELGDADAARGYSALLDATRREDAAAACAELGLAL